MKIAFTICSNNYLAQAKTLMDSFLNHNSEYVFVIGLCDKISEDIDYRVFHSCRIIPVEDLSIKGFDEMVKNYSIIELNTAVKPFYFKYLMQEFEDVELIIYLDPDIVVYNNFNAIEEEIKGNNALLTPHIARPIVSDGKLPDENVFLNFGIYNLGFIALIPSKISFSLLEWWGRKMEVACFDRVSEGYFVDQLPMNFAPLFYPSVVVSRNPGLNVAYWNLQERELSGEKGNYYVNHTDPLIFFHFSSYRITEPENMSRFQNRFAMNDQKIWKEMFSDYCRLMEENGFFRYSGKNSFYTEVRNKYLERIEKQAEKKEKLKSKIKRKLIHGINRLLS